MLDSGTTLTYFPRSLFNKVVEWINEEIKEYNKR